jgi:hypothetical protein
MSLTIEEAAGIHGVFLGKLIPERLEVHRCVEVEGLSLPLGRGLHQSFLVRVEVLVVAHPDLHERYLEPLELGGLLPRFAGVAPLRQHRRFIQQTQVDYGGQQSTSLPVHLRKKTTSGRFLIEPFRLALRRRVSRPSDHCDHSARLFRAIISLA